MTQREFDIYVTNIDYLDSSGATEAAYLLRVEFLDRYDNEGVTHELDHELAAGIRQTDAELVERDWFSSPLSAGGEQLDTKAHCIDTLVRHS